MARIGYYDMSEEAGSASQIAGIERAGHTAVQMFDLSKDELSKIDVLVVNNPDNDAHGAEYLRQLDVIKEAVGNGLSLIIHDREVDNAEKILPGGENFNIVREQNWGDQAQNVEVVDDKGAIAHGDGGDVTDVSLDGGWYSNHGFIDVSKLPEGAAVLLTRADPNEAVTVAYEHGAGHVVYSTIPLDYYLASYGDGGLNDAMGAYYSNLLDWAADTGRTIEGTPRIDELVGTNRNDVIDAKQSDDVVDAGAGNDTVIGGSGNDVINAGEGDDIVYGGGKPGGAPHAGNKPAPADNDTIDAGGGNDKVYAGNGDDTVDGGSGNDVIFGGKGNDVIRDGEGDDQVSGNSGDDHVFAGAGNDSFLGNAGFDTLDFSGASGGITLDVSKSTVSGAGIGSDTFRGFETFVGSDFNDTMKGGKLADALIGGKGDDVIRGMAGADTLTGGDGHDTFVFTKKDLADETVDVIKDFDVNADMLNLADLLSGAKFDKGAHVKLTDTEHGTLVSVATKTFKADVVMLENVHLGNHTGVDAGWLLA